MVDISGRDKILLHLEGREYTNYESEYPFLLCQEGIGESVELSQNRVSTLLGDMERDGLVEKMTERLKYTHLKRNVYFLTDKGKEKADEKIEELKDEVIFLKYEGKEKEIKMEDLEEYIGGNRPYLFAVNHLKDGVLNLDQIGEDEVFVDRSVEIRELKDKLERVKKNGSFTFLISGYTGVGKTRLVDQIKEEASSHDYKIFEEKAFPESTRSYFPLQNIFSEIDERFETAESVEKPLILKSEELKDSDLKREDKDQKYVDEAIYQEATQWLKKMSSKHPLLIFLDDLQWSKETTYHLLHHLSLSLEEAPVYLIGAYRKDEVGRGSLRDTIEKISCIENSQTLDLKSFDWKETSELIFKRLGRKTIPKEFIDMCQDFTKGNPLFLDAMIDELLERGDLDPIKGRYPEDKEELGLSDEVKKLYDVKLDRLSELEKEILQKMSCFVDEVSEELLYSLLDKDEEIAREKIENLIDMNLLERSLGGELNFSHDMIRSATYETIPEDEKKRYHLFISEKIEDILDSESERYHTRIARHKERADKFEEAVEFYLKAGRRAENAYANDEAIRLYENALKIHEQRDISRVKRNEILERLADARRRKKKFEEAKDSLEKAKEKVEKDEKKVRLHRKTAECSRYMRDYDKALEEIEEGLSTISENDSLEDLEERCELLKEKGIIYMRKNEYEESRELFDRMRRVSEEIGAKTGQGKAHHYLGSIAIYRSDLDKAKKNLQKAISIFEETDDLEQLSGSYNNLGIVYRNQMEYGKALNHLKKANMLEKEATVKDGSRWALDNIGSIYNDMGKLDKSLEYHEKCLELEKKIDDKHGIAASLDNMGVCNYNKGKFDAAIDYHERSLELKEELENRNGISLSLYNLGKAYRGKGELDKALEYLEESLEIREDLGEKQHIAYSRLWLGILNIDLGDMEKAEKYLNEALEIFREVGVDYGMGMCLSYVGRLKALTGSLDKAKMYGEHSSKIGQDFEDLVFDIQVNRNLAEVQIERGEYSEALKRCRDSLERAEKSGAKNEMGVSRKVLGRIFFKSDLFENADREFQKAYEILDEVGNKMEKARVLLLWGKMLSQRGQERGLNKISSAGDLVEECGLEGWCSEADHIPDKKL